MARRKRCNRRGRASMLHTGILHIMHISLLACILLLLLPQTITLTHAQQQDNAINNTNASPIETSLQLLTPAPTTAQPTTAQPTTSQPSPKPTTSEPTIAPTITFAPTQSPTLDPVVAESATWASVRVTALVSTLTMLALISLYEIGRRSHTLRDIFDRKRETRPGRTPPRLLSGSGPLGWICYVGEYFFVDGYVYKEYADYARRVQDEEEAREEAARNRSRRRHGDGAAVVDPDGFRWPSSISPSASNEGSTKDMNELEEDVQNNEPNRIFFPGDDEEEEEKEEVVEEENTSVEETGHAVKVEADSIMTGTFATPTVSTTSEKTVNFQGQGAAVKTHIGDEEEAKFAGEEETTNNEASGDASADMEESTSPQSDTTEKASANLSGTKTSRQHRSTATKRQKAPPRWRYFCVRPGSRFGSLLSYRKQKAHGPLSPRNVRELADWRASIDATSEMPIDEQESWWQKCLKYIPVLQPLELTETDRELLRCIGLDSYVMIRFLRLGFEMTFWPFVAACIILIPTYYTNDYDGSFAWADDSSNTGFSTTTTTGYFRITINRLENRSPKIWIVWLFAIAYYLVLLRRMWVEWVIFVDLREDFLANGDPDATKEDDPESLKQFRNSCTVEYIPPSHRRDKDMLLFFESLFPGQVRRAEMIVNSARLTTLIQERQKYIAAYESVYAKQVHQENEYLKTVDMREKDERSGCGCKRRTPSEPEPIKIRVGGGKCCSGGGELVEALPHFMSEIERTNDLVDEEYKRIVRRKEDEERESILSSMKEVKPGSKKPASLMKTIHVDKYLANILLPHGNTDNRIHADCGNGFVEFSTRAAKQAALQCNLTGQATYFSTEQAPDPRDIIWMNMPAASSTIRRNYVMVQGFLLIGILFWSALVGLIGNIETAVVNSGIDISPNLLGFIAGYLPVLILLILMATIPSIFTVLAVKVVRFRSRSESDKFVLKWNYLYRIANFCVILISGTLYNTLLSASSSPAEVVESVANGVLVQSQFFFNVVLTAIGTGTSLQISQLWSVLYWLIVKNIITEEAMSERKLEQMKVPKDFIFGRFTAEFIYVFMIAIVYCAMVPLITGACAFYFFFASKIYTHQALFVFSQQYEGGGKLFYSLNRTVFVLIYVSIVIFGTVLALKELPIASAIFLVCMICVTYIVDSEIHKKFSATSQKLPLTRARIIDEEYVSLLGNEVTVADVQARRSEMSQLSSAGASAGVDRRKLFSSSARMKTLRNLNTSVGMGVGLPSLIARKDSRGSENLDFYLYRQPDLHKHTWETEPRPYRLDE